MLERVALHQARLRTPGLRLDANGVALGARGLVLLPTLDRLVAFLALYTAENSLADLLPTLTVELCESRLRTREFVLRFAAEGTDGLDRIASVAHLAGGYAFTGTDRFFVQYRDAASPLGYDVSSLPEGDGDLALAHQTFEQRYQLVKPLDLAGLLTRLELVRAPSDAVRPSERWLLCEPALGEALVAYFLRSGVAADVGIAEWPPASALEAGPRRRHVFRVPELPERMVPLLTRTPGVGVHVPAGQGCVVELGWRHPVNLRGCPVFSPEGLVFLGRKGRAPVTLERLPAMGPVSAFARVELRTAEAGTPETGRPVVGGSLDLEVAVVPTPRPPRNVTATFVRDLGLLRRLAYRVGPNVLREARLALVEEGAMLLCPGGVEALPLGEFFEELHPQLYVSAGHAPAPALDPARILAAHAAGTRVVFLRHGAPALAIERGAFVPLGDALLGAQRWRDTTAEVVAVSLDAPLPTLVLEPPELRPMRDFDDEVDEG